MSADDDIETPVVERKMLVGDSEPESVNKLISPLSSMTTQSIVTPTPSKRNITVEESDMSQSYHEIFDTQGYVTQDSPVSVTTPGTETGSGSVDSGHTETGHPVHGAVVYYNALLPIIYFKWNGFSIANSVTRRNILYQVIPKLLLLFNVSLSDNNKAVNN